MRCDTSTPCSITARSRSPIAADESGPRTSLDESLTGVVSTLRGGGAEGRAAAARESREEKGARGRDSGEGNRATIQVAPRASEGGSRLPVAALDAAAAGTDAGPSTQDSVLTITGPGAGKLLGGEDPGPEEEEGGEQKQQGGEEEQERTAPAHETDPGREDEDDPRPEEHAEAEAEEERGRLRQRSDHEHEQEAQRAARHEPDRRPDPRRDPRPRRVDDRGRLALRLREGPEDEPSDRRPRVLAARLLPPVALGHVVRLAAESVRARSSSGPSGAGASSRTASPAPTSVNAVRSAPAASSAAPARLDSISGLHTAASTRALGVRSRMRRTR